MKKVYLEPKTKTCVNFSTNVTMLAGSLGDGDNTLGSGVKDPEYDNRVDEEIEIGGGNALSKKRFYTDY